MDNKNEISQTQNIQIFSSLNFQNQIDQNNIDKMQLRKISKIYLHLKRLQIKTNLNVDQNIIKNVLQLLQKKQYQNLKIGLDVSKFVEEHDKIVNAFIDKLIDETSKIKDLYKDYAQKHYKFSLLNEAEKKIWQQLHKNQLNQLKGFQFAQLFFDMNQQKVKNINIEEEQAQIIEKWKDIEDLIIIEMKQFSTQLLSQKINLSLNLSQKKNLFQKSNIIKTIEEKQTMVKLLNRKIKNADLLYKASENQFKLDSFYNKCSNIPHTLVLIKTQFGKKIGGFTSLCWKKVQTQQRLVDVSNSSFIFSLSNNQKLTETSLIESGIWNYKNFGPIFGMKNSSCDIAISNQANKNNNSTIRFGFGYSNNTYNKQTKQTYQRFSGNPNHDHSISLQQWQVWSLIYQQ